MQKKYKRILLFLGMLILLVIVIGVAYLFYDKISAGTKVEVVEELSINYLDGNNINGNKIYNFSITNNGENDIYYELLMNNLKNYENKVLYSLSSNEANIDYSNSKFDTNTNIIASNILISKGTTQYFKIYLINNEMTSFDLKVRKTIDSKEYFYSTILKNNEVSKNATTKVGSEIANDAEGLIEDLDDYGITYYFRGKVDNNYVSFADDLWRIVRINGDGTVRLILDNTLTELSSYHNKYENYEDLENTSYMDILNNYYNTYLMDYDSYISSSKFCQEVEKNDNKTYNAYTRIYTNKIPAFNCFGSVINKKIGLISADEVIYAGGLFGQDNTNYYLYNKDITGSWWTSNLATFSDSDFNPILVNSKGALANNTSGLTYEYLRPVINLNRKVMATGTGTINDPYNLAL